MGLANKAGPDLSVYCSLEMHLSDYQVLMYYNSAPDRNEY